MTHIAVQNIEKKFINKKTPILRPGYQVRVHQKIKEGEKERVQVFEGLVISLNAGHGASKTFKVRKVVDGIGVEKTFPVYSPNIVKIEIKKTFKVRRAKLTYLRKSEGLSKRLSAKLGLIERDENMKKRKGLVEEEKVEVPAQEEVSEIVENASDSSGNTAENQDTESNAAAETSETKMPHEATAESGEAENSEVKEEPAGENPSSIDETKAEGLSASEVESGDATSATEEAPEAEKASA